MRILMLHEDPRNTERGNGGGAESMRHDLCEALEREGHETRIWRNLKPLPDALDDYQPDIVHVSTIHNFIGLHPLEYLQAHNVPHVLALMDYWPFCGGRMLLHDQDCSCPAVRGTCDNSCGENSSGRFLPLVNRSFVVALNANTADIYRRNGIRVGAVAEIGIDTDRFRPDYSARTEQVSVWTHSAWASYPTKGMHVLARAFAGSGLQANLLTDYPREVIAEQLRRAHIHVTPSTYEETWCLCLTEAMASGCACVASDVAGPRAQIQDGVTGLLVPPKNADALRDAVQRLVRDDDLRERMGRAAREWAVEFASYRPMAQRWIAAYTAALAR